MWYDLFSYFYDWALEDLYALYRPLAVEALELSEGDCVLDVPCGSGQSFRLLVEAVGRKGHVMGIDRSRGMMNQARRRIARAGWTNVELHRFDVSRMTADRVAVVLGRMPLDGVLCSLGLTALPHFQRTFETLFALVRPGGRFVLLDVYAPEPTRASRMVEFVARADLSRRAWRPLEKASEGFRREVVSDDHVKFGGELYIASGTKPLSHASM